MNISSTNGYKHPDPAALFKRVDADGSGGISKDELSAMLQKRSEKMTSAQGTTPNVDQIFSAADTNGDGQINQAEMETAMKAMRPHHHGNRSSGFSGSSDTLDSILTTLKNQDDGKDAALTSDQRKVLEQIVNDLKKNGTYTPQGTSDSTGSAGFFTTSV